MERVLLRVIVMAVVLFVLAIVLSMSSLGYNITKFIFGQARQDMKPMHSTLHIGESGSTSTTSHHDSASLKTIPRILHMTYYDKAAIPPKVHDNIRNFAPGYDVRIYDDSDCEAMLTNHFSPEVLERFRSLKGAHKADLLRYCYLLKDGGVYVDIKTELIMPLDHIIDHTQPNLFYTVLSAIISDTIYQGIIACPPHHPVIRECLMFIVHLPPWVSRVYYSIFTTDMHAVIRKRCRAKRLNAGWLTEDTKYSTANRYYVFPTLSSFSNPPEESVYHCKDGLDRYGICEYMLAGDEPPHSQFTHTKGTPLIKIRYADFPWKSRASQRHDGKNQVIMSDGH